MNLNQRQSKRIFECLLICGLIGVPVFGQSLALKPQLGPGDFPLVHKNRAATIVISTGDFTVAQIAAADLATDIEKVTGRKPAVTSDSKEQIEYAVIIGTLGKSQLIDTIVKSNKLDASRIRGKWESYVIVTVERPLPNIKSALVIVGSDRRGTAFSELRVYQGENRLVPRTDVGSGARCLQASWKI